jgi:MinD-like ATPase involved in chromosome partitioning or flagellar assembly
LLALPGRRLPGRTGLKDLLRRKKSASPSIGRREARVIGVFSCKGGVGKTTTVVNTGVALANMLGKERVLLFDANFGAPNLCLHFGELTPEVTVHDVVSRGLPLESAIMESQGVKSVFGSIAFEDEVHITDLGELIEPLRSRFNIILVDTAPGIGKEVVVALKACDEMMIVTNPYVPTIASTLKTFRAAEKYKVPIFGVVVNRVAGYPFELSMTEVKRSLGWPVVAQVPESRLVQEATAAGIPVVRYKPRCKASKGFVDLADKVMKHLRESR